MHALSEKTHVAENPNPPNQPRAFRARCAKGPRLVWRVWIFRHMGFFTQGMHIPAPLAFLTIRADFLGSIGLILGFPGRAAVFGIACNMMVAVAMVHWHYGFFANWLGNQKGEGFEYHILALAIALAIMITGSGAFSIDRALSN